MIETVKEIKPMDYSKTIEEPFELIQEEKIEEKIEDIKPINKIRGWHFMDEFIDKDHNIFRKGKWEGNDPSKIPTEPKKA
jgi:hypothetical protein